ncbi:MAG TPA: DUF2235 domain-containing protein [Rhodanobacter sp.]|jgi:hypothetical protein|nr:DUF2235 domain-containing protein [Rhodanobacter sp.]
MSHEHKLDKDGIRNDGVPHYEADASRLKSHIEASETLSRFSAPLLVHSDNPHQHLYLAALDGTGNDLYKDPRHATNIAKIYEQIGEVGNHRIAAGYVPGPGTQDQFLTRTIDGINGNTYDERVEQMYEKFIDHAWAWKKDDPQAEISLVAVGFSRGSEQAAGLARLVHDRGIQDPAGAVYTRDQHDQIMHVEYTRPPLVEPGQVVQAVALLDPVGTGEAVRAHDRRLPPSVISGFEIIAADERRALFKSDHIIDPGMTPDGRFLGVAVAGTHSDIGGSYHRDGLAIRSGNLLITYLNTLSDRPFLKLQAVPGDPRLNVVHGSEDGKLIYRLGRKVNRFDAGGYNELLVPKRMAGQVSDPYNAEPRDEVLNGRFERQAVKSSAQTVTPDAARDERSGDLSMRLDRMLAAGQANDWAKFSRENLALAHGDAGRNMLERASLQAGWLEQQAAQQQAMPAHFMPQPATEPVTQH